VGTQVVCRQGTACICANLYVRDAFAGREFAENLFMFASRQRLRFASIRLLPMRFNLAQSGEMRRDECTNDVLQRED
jgi:hypothetical protein